MKIGIITAMAKEIAPLYEKLGVETQRISRSGVEIGRFTVGDHDVYLAQSGVGEISAAMTVQMLYDVYGVEVILNFGFVGSLDARFEVGDLVLVEKVVHYQFDTSAIDPVPVGMYFNRDDLYFHLDRGLIERLQAQLEKPLPLVVDASGDKFIATSADREYLRTFGAHICEMECAGLALACERIGLPFLSVKVISDKADEAADVTFAEVFRRGLTNYERILPHVLAAVGR